MPVPVPPVPTAHPVHKCSKPKDIENPRSSVFHLFKYTLPSLTDSSSSLGSRERWSNTLPLRSRAITRYVPDDSSSPRALVAAHRGFSEGLAGAVDAPAIKGAHVQTCIPPLNTLLPGGSSEMSSCSSPPPGQCVSLDHTRLNELASQFSSAQPELIAEDVPAMRAWPHAPDLYLEDDGGLFAPVLEDDSPDMTSGDVDSSPIEPVTPFGDYVDRAVAASDAEVIHDPLILSRSQELQLSVSLHCNTKFCHHPYLRFEAEESIVAADEHPPTATLIHKQLAEPMAEWLVSYVWKVCTNVLVLPQTIAPYALPNAPQLRQPLPLHLTARVHSLLMSTLLQPSAMFLALWYIVRLPTYFGAGGLGPEHVKERRFRVDLLSDTQGIDGESPEGAAAFRLIVLGCMLANKWLDDHTFSNKTWHTISNVPVPLLNKLEYFALDILSYDLSISPPAWSHWLSHLLLYNHSLTTSTYPQPIARPASSPNGLIRKTIQEIMEAPLGRSMNEPVFLGVEQRLREKLGLSTRPHEPETLDIDLDEDGPLRKEYLPRRLVSNGGSSSGHDLNFRKEPQNGTPHRVLPRQGSVDLPPPAKWSPAADEPICRTSGRTASIYLPVQPPPYLGAIPAVYHPWPTAGLPYAPFRHYLDDYTMNGYPIPQFAYWAPVSCPSTVQPSQPLCASDYYTGLNVQGYSLGGVDYRCNDMHLSRGTGYRDQPMASWTPLHRYGNIAPRHSLALRPPLDHCSGWIPA